MIVINSLRYMKAFIYLLAWLVLLLTFMACNSGRNTKSDKTTCSRGYIVTSSLNPGYFQYTDGTPYIPIGINMINPGRDYRHNPDSALYEIESWMKNLSENGGNYVRVWLSQSFWDIEDEQAGKYNEEKIKRIDRFIEMARQNNLRIKMTLEHFRSLTLEENPQPWATKSVYHTSKGGPLDSIGQYLTSPAGHKLFLDKVDFYKERYGNDTLFFGWELWNEMNAMRVPEDSVFLAWNKKMLGEVKRRFPENLVMQSLGSFDNENVRPVYRRMMLMAGNQVAQVHRYLDLGAMMEVCHMPMDIICSSAVEEILSYNTGKPVILAETGAVEPRHSGPSKLYMLDTAGILLHDILFAPFFSGSAGTGMSWHWDSYVARNNLWYHFGRFSEAIKQINPLEEEFKTSKMETDAVRIYILTGKGIVLFWVRDKNNDWESELRNGQPPSTLKGIQIDMKLAGVLDYEGKITVYDPWEDKWKKAKRKSQKILLPDFKRSLVVRISR